jgi:hydrogenase maturation protease
MKTLVLGLGNPILGDDGAGWRVVEEVARRFPSPLPPSPGGRGAGGEGIECDYVSLGGLSLMERLTGYPRVILVDSMKTGEHPVGTVRRFALSELPDLTAGHSASAHDTSLRNALNVGRSMNVPLPEDQDVLIVAIEAENVYDFSEQLSPSVAAAVPEAVRAVLELLQHQ